MPVSGSQWRARRVAEHAFVLMAGLFLAQGVAAQTEGSTSSVSPSSAPVAADGAATPIDTQGRAEMVEVVGFSKSERGNLPGPQCRRRSMERVCTERFAQAETDFTAVVRRRSGVGTTLLRTLPGPPGCVYLEIVLGRDHSSSPFHRCRGAPARLDVEVRFTRRVVPSAGSVPQ